MNEQDDRLHELLDGVNSGSDAAASDSALPSDAVLRARVAALRGLDTWLRATRGRAPSLLHREVERRLRETPVTPLAPARRPAAGPRTWLWAAVPAALAAAVALAFLARGPLAPAPSTDGDAASVPAASIPDDTVRYTFRLQAPGASEVCLAGDFNRWKVCETRLARVEEDVWTVAVELPRGRHEYMFVIDGRWVTDPSATLHSDDGFGNRNAVILL